MYQRTKLRLEKKIIAHQKNFDVLYFNSFIADSVTLNRIDLRTLNYIECVYIHVKAVWIL